MSEYLKSQLLDASKPEPLPQALWPPASGLRTEEPLVDVESTTVSTQASASALTSYVSETRPRDGFAASSRPKFMTLHAERSLTGM